MSEFFNKNADVAIAKGAFSLTLATVIVKLLGVIYKIPIAHFLGEEGMGYYNSAYTVYSVFYLLCTAGVPKAVTLLLSRDDSFDLKKQKTSKILSSFLLVGIGTFSVLVILASPLSILVGNKKALFTLISIAPSIVFVSMSGVLRGYLTERMSMGAIAVSQIIEGVIKLALGLLLAMLAIRLGLKTELSSALSILGVTLGSIASYIYLRITSKVKFKSYKPEQNTCNISIKDVLRISFPITVSAAVLSISNIVDLVSIINIMKSVGYDEATATGIYGAYTTYAVPILNLVISVVTPISVTFLPALARNIRDKDTVSQLETINYSLRLSAFICAPLTVGIFFYSKDAIVFLFGDDTMQIASVLLSILIVSAVFMSPLIIVNSALEAKGSLGAPMVSMLIGATVKVVAGYLLMNNELFGIMGAPMGTVLSYAVSLFVSLAVLSFKHKLSPSLFRSQILPYLCGFASVLSSIYVDIKSSHFLDRRLEFLLLIIVAATVYVILSAFSGFLGKRAWGDKKGITIADQKCRAKNN